MSKKSNIAGIRFSNLVAVGLTTECKNDCHDLGNAFAPAGTKSLSASPVSRTGTPPAAVARANRTNLAC